MGEKVTFMEIVEGRGAAEDLREVDSAVGCGVEGGADAEKNEGSSIQLTGMACERGECRYLRELASGPTWVRFGCVTRWQPMQAPVLADPTGRKLVPVGRPQECGRELVWVHTKSGWHAGNRGVPGTSRDKVLGSLSAGPLPLAEICEFTGLTRGQAAGALRLQERRGVVVQSEGKVPTLFGSSYSWSLTRKGQQVLRVLIRLGRIIESEG